MESGLLIGGALVQGGGEAVAVTNPATGGAIIDIAEATTAQVDAAVAAAAGRPGSATA